MNLFDKANDAESFIILKGLNPADALLQPFWSEDD
jgi:hypothetical protein